MRDLEFRAYDKHLGKYVTDLETLEYDVFISSDKIESYDGIRFGTCLLDHWGDFILEQYTGLKDKNGREIYEGDILLNGKGEAIEIGWNDKYARFGFHGSRAGFFAFCDFTGCEVIGNIHENSELLEEKE